VVSTNPIVPTHGPQRTKGYLPLTARCIASAESLRNRAWSTRTTADQVREPRIRPRRCADVVRDVAGAAIERHLEQLLPARRGSAAFHTHTRTASRLPVPPGRRRGSRSATRSRDGGSGRDDGASVVGASAGNVSTHPTSNCLHAISAARARAKSTGPRPITNRASSMRRGEASSFSTPTGAYESGSVRDSSRNRWMAAGDDGGQGHWDLTLKRERRTARPASAHRSRRRRCAPAHAQRQRRRRQIWP